MAIPGLWSWDGKEKRRVGREEMDEGKGRRRKKEKEKEKGERTISRPRSLAGPQRRHGGDAADLEPDVAGGVPGVDVGAVGHAGHVELHGAEVRDGGHGDEAQHVAGGDRRRGLARRRLVAPHVRAVDVRHPRVALVVLGHPHRLPLRGLGLPLHDQLREVVCVRPLSAGCLLRPLSEDRTRGEGKAMDSQWAWAAPVSARTVSSFIFAICYGGRRGVLVRLGGFVVPGPVGACVG